MTLLLVVGEGSLRGRSLLDSGCLRLKGEMALYDGWLHLDLWFDLRLLGERGRLLDFGVVLRSRGIRWLLWKGV